MFSVIDRFVDYITSKICCSKNEKLVQEEIKEEDSDASFEDLLNEIRYLKEIGWKIHNNGNGKVQDEKIE